MYNLMLALIRRRKSDSGLITDWKWIEGHPETFGWYHFMWLGIMVLACFLLSYFLGRKHNSKTDDKVIFGFGIFLLLIETYKQIFSTLEAGHFQWYMFPFQFCSVPMYVAVIAPLIKREKVKDAMYKFLAYFGLTAGLAVMVYPESCLYTPYVTILIHTMAWHCSMVIMGVYLIVAKGYGKNFLNEVMPAAMVYSVFFGMAFWGNIIMYHAFFNTPLANGESCNFFYISPYYRSTLPILSTIWGIVETSMWLYPVFVLAYIAAFLIGISAIFGGVRLIVYLSKKPRNKKVQTLSN